MCFILLNFHKVDIGAGDGLVPSAQLTTDLSFQTSDLHSLCFFVNWANLTVSWAAHMEGFVPKYGVFSDEFNYHSFVQNPLWASFIDRV